MVMPQMTQLLTRFNGLELFQYCQLYFLLKRSWLLDLALHMEEQSQPDVIELMLIWCSAKVKTISQEHTSELRTQLT